MLEIFFNFWTRILFFLSISHDFFFLTLKIALLSLAQGRWVTVRNFRPVDWRRQFFPFTQHCTHTHSPFYKKGVRELTRLFFRAQKHSKMTKLGLWGAFDLHIELKLPTKTLAFFKRKLIWKIFWRKYFLLKKD